MVRAPQEPQPHHKFDHIGGSNFFFVRVTKTRLKSLTTVDGRNPAAPDDVQNPVNSGRTTYQPQLVQDLFYQQYHSNIIGFIAEGAQGG